MGLKIEEIPKTNEHLWEYWSDKVPFADIQYNDYRFETIRSFDYGKHFTHYLMNIGIGKEGVELKYEYNCNMDDYFY